MLKRIIKSVYLLIIVLVVFTPIKKETQNLSFEKASASSFFEQVPENQLINGDALIKEHPGLTSCIVLKDNKVYMERYYNNRNMDSIYEIHSETKTIIGLLTGIAVDQGYIESENTPYYQLLPTVQQGLCSDEFKGIVLNNVLTMSSGIDWDTYEKNLSVRLDIMENGLEQGLYENSKMALNFQPGTELRYDSNESRFLMALIANCAEMSDLEFAEKFLFSKLDIRDYVWPYNDSGLLAGGKDLFLSSRDMAKIGSLYLNHGKYNGQQVVSPEWIEKSLDTYVSGHCEDLKPEDTLDYGYFIWSTSYKGHSIKFFYGAGGQYVFLVPDMKLCVVTSALDKDRKDNFRQIVYDFIDYFVGEK